MAGPQSFGDFLTRAMESIGQWFRALFARLSGRQETAAAEPAPQAQPGRAQIREDVTQRMADFMNDPDVNHNMGRAFGQNAFRMIGDRLFRGGITEEASARIQRSMRAMESELPLDDQASLREIRRLHAAGDFSPQELEEIGKQAFERAQQAAQRAR